MAKVIQVKLVPSVQYGRFTWNAQPIDAQGDKVLKACKQQFNYKPRVVNGKPQDRSTFDPQWVDFLSTVSITLQVNEVPNIPAFSVGDAFNAPKPTVDFDSCFE